ncbi:MAG: hypothetical protein KAH54_10955 [Candidatus Sabulitectum sp.]|nr:hypothetical protein [Candidatus Sabulitectum sp.]
MNLEFRAGLLGWPLVHSLSPVIHDIFMQHYRMDGSYRLFPVESANLLTMVADLKGKGFTGLNVTVPHKIAVGKLCATLSPEAEAAGAVNTMVFKDGIVRGYNTDVAGFRVMAATLPSPLFVVGKGGVAGAVRVALKSSEVTFLGRGEIIPETDRPARATVVNATRIGWNDTDIFPLDIPSGWSFADLNYNPRWLWRNSLSSPVVTGERMLVEQAAESFRLWTGHTPDEELKTMVLERIRETLHEK